MRWAWNSPTPGSTSPFCASSAPAWSRVGSSRACSTRCWRSCARGLLKARGRQRTDSTYVLAAVRAVNRLESVGETLRAALNTLATVAPDWLAQHADAEWPDRYG